MTAPQGAHANRAVFTVVTKSYLAYARVMGREMRARHPETSFYVFLADLPDGCFEPEQEPFNIVSLKDFFPEELMATMPGYYTAYEFSNALKAFAHLHLAEKIGVERWLYLDSDMLLCGSLEGLFADLDDCSILLTSHILQPFDLMVSERTELNILRTGLYNGGFVGLRNTSVARKFLSWWKERLIWHCLGTQPGLEADQTWLNFVPLLFSEVKILRKPEVNVGHWNLHERELVLDAAGKVQVGGAQLSLMHFSGWDWHNPEKVSRHAQPNLGNSTKAWISLSMQFAKLLQDADIQTSSAWPYSFSKSSNGREISPGMRRNFLQYCLKHRNQPLEATVFTKPKMFRDTGGKPTLKAASRAWVGALLRTFGWRRRDRKAKFN
jgi:hypothetical protein